MKDEVGGSGSGKLPDAIRHLQRVQQETENRIFSIVSCRGTRYLCRGSYNKGRSSFSLAWHSQVIKKGEVKKKKE